MNLFVVWTESYGEALKISNLLSNQGGHVLDCSIIGKWSQVMVHFEDKTIEKSLSSLALTNTHKKAWLPGIKNEIVESYLSLSTQKVGEFLLTIEADFIGDVFELLQVLNLEQYPLVDLRLLRFSEPRCLLILTGAQSESDKLLVLIENLKAQGKNKFKSEMIMPVSNPIRELFHHSPQS